MSATSPTRRDVLATSTAAGTVSLLSEHFAGTADGNEMPPASVIVLPGNTSHFHLAKSGEYVTQVTAIGPSFATSIAQRMRSRSMAAALSSDQPGRKENIMPGRKSSLCWKAVVCALSFTVSRGIAVAQNAAPPPAVSVTPVVSRQVTETGDYIGRVTAIDKVDIVARVPGFIEERTFTEGQLVKKGDLLFRIEQATYKAAVEQAEINLGYTEIRSPIDGRIGLATFTVGNLVQPSSGRLATIVSQDPIYVIFQVSERDVLEYRRRVAESASNTHVTIHIKLPDGSSYPHPGLSNFLDVQVDATTDTVAVRAQVPNPDGLLSAGGVVGVTVERGAPRSALTIPQSAVLLDQAGRYVLLVDAEKKVEQRRVTIGVEQGRNVVVSDGLKAGELVIVEGIQKVRPGQVVTANVVPGT